MKYLGVVIEEEHNHILGFYNAFKEYLILGLKEPEFADLYAQTITYGLFAARTRCRGEFHRKNALAFIPQTIGLLHDVFEYISVGQAPEQLEWIIDDIAEVLASVDVGVILNQFYQEGKGEDPIVHFYETFLSEYDPKIWEYRIGGYQVLNKWLKDCKGRNLSLEDIQHYIRISRTLELTIHYQEKIDHLYPQVEESLLNIQTPNT